MYGSEDELSLLRCMLRFRQIQLTPLHPGLSRGEFMLLGVLAHQNTCCESVSSLADALEMPPPAVSRIMRGLENRGLILRTIDPVDRRNIRVTLTEQGQVVEAEVRERLHAFWNATLAALTPEEVAQLIARWTHLADAMEDALSQISKINQGKELHE